MTTTVDMEQDSYQQDPTNQNSMDDTPYHRDEEDRSRHRDSSRSPLRGGDDDDKQEPRRSSKSPSRDRRDRSPNASYRRSTPYDRPSYSRYGGSGGGREYGSRGQSRHSGPPPPPPPKESNKECRVYVGNLAYEVNWQDLKDFMKQGRISFLNTLLIK